MVESRRKRTHYTNGGNAMNDKEILDELLIMLEICLICDWDYNDAGEEFLRLANYVTRMRKGEPCEGQG